MQNNTRINNYLKNVIKEETSKLDDLLKEKEILKKEYRDFKLKLLVLENNLKQLNCLIPENPNADDVQDLKFDIIGESVKLDLAKQKLNDMKEKLTLKDLQIKNQVNVCVNSRVNLNWLKNEVDYDDD